MSRYTSKSARIELDRKILRGVDEHVTKNMVLNGETISPKSFTAAINEALSTQDEVDQQRLQLAALVKAARIASDRATQLTSALRKYLMVHYGEDSPVLSEFGFAPRKVTRRTVAEKYQAVEKRLATRAARYTMGSRPNAEVHGAPVAAPPASSQPNAIPPNGVGH